MTKTVWNNSNWVNDDGDDDGFITTTTTKKNSAATTTTKKKKKKKKKKSNNVTDASTTAAAPSDPTITSNKYRALVIDSGPIIRFDTSTSSTMNNVADKYYTTPSVMAEIKDAKARDHLSQLPYELELRTPSSVSMNAIVNFARQTGDYASLSRVDLQVLALTYELEMEGCNGNVTHIRTTKKKNNMTMTTAKNAASDSAVVIQQADKAGGGVNTDENHQDDDDDDEETEVYIHDETKDVAIFASTTGVDEIEVVPENHPTKKNESSSFTNFWNQYENISQKLSNLEQSVGIHISPIKSQMELEEEEKEEESVGKDDEEESEKEEEVDPTTTTTAAPKSWAMMVDPTASSVTETTTAFPKTKIVLPKQQQQQTVKSSFFDEEEGSDGSNSAGQFSDAEEDEEEFAFPFGNLNTTTTAIQEKNGNQIENKGTTTTSGFQFNLLPPKQETTAGGGFRFNLLPTSPIQKGEEEEKNDYFVEEEDEDDDDDDFPTLTALALDDEDDNNENDEDVTPAILAKQKAEKNRLEALQSVSKSGKQYNSFRKYRDVIKPKVVRKEEEEEEPEELSPLQNIVSDNEDEKPKDNRSRILGSTTGAVVMRQDEDDGEGWVTSKKDITKMKSMGRLNPRTDPSKIDASLLSSKKKLDKNPPTSMRTACATTDFAMQNVLLQMNLELVTPDGGMRITKLKSWVTRCGACFMVYPDNDLTKSLYRNMNKRLFCSRCGSGDMMQRIAASVNNTTGELRLHFSKKYRPNLRGTKFSLPANNSKNVDRYRGDLLLREDQLLMGSWNQKLLRNSSKKNKESLFGCDLAEHVGCNSKQGSHTSLDGPIRVGFGRQNPNAAKGGRERRGKKKKGNTQSKACGLRRY